MATSGKGSRAKGKNAELEVAKILREYGYDAHRGKVFYGEPDIVGVPRLHIEVKRQEQLKLKDWLIQSESQKREDEFATVVHRKNREDWLITMKFEDFLTYINLPRIHPDGWKTYIEGKRDGLPFEDPVSGEVYGGEEDV